MAEVTRVPAGEGDALAAELHAAAFAGRERAWTAAEFADLRRGADVFLLLAGTPPAALLLGRVAGGEAELLTLGAAPAARRQGLGAALLAGFAAAARAGGAEAAFLEVGTGNTAARALYTAAGWAEIGRRRNYVHLEDGSREDALVMKLDL